MSVNLFRANVLVICAAISQASPTPKSAAPPVLDAAAHPEAYEIYATSLEQLWKGHKGSLLVRQETDTGMSCVSLLSTQTGEWAEVVKDFHRQNAVERLLQPALPMKIQYSFIRKSEIEADDASVRLQYPEAWQATGYIEYGAVSSVGFNRDRTKAIVSVHLRNGNGQGWIGKLEFKDGHWRATPGPSACPAPIAEFDAFSIGRRGILRPRLVVAGAPVSFSAAVPAS